MLGNCDLDLLGMYTRWVIWLLRFLAVCEMRGNVALAWLRVCFNIQSGLLFLLVTVIELIQTNIRVAGWESKMYVTVCIQNIRAKWIRNPVVPSNQKILTFHKAGAVYKKIPNRDNNRNAISKSEIHHLEMEQTQTWRRYRRVEEKKTHKNIPARDNYRTQTWKITSYIWVEVHTFLTFRIPFWCLFFFKYKCLIYIVCTYSMYAVNAILFVTIQPAEKTFASNLFFWKHLLYDE